MVNAELIYCSFLKSDISESLCVLGAIICLVITALAGFKIMKQLSAVHVVVFNTCRSIIVWVFSMAVSWQNFQVLQIVGFLVIIIGVMVFNDILIKGK